MRSDGVGGTQLPARLAAALLTAAAACGATRADPHYSDAVVSDTSLSPAAYPYSADSATGPSRLALVNGKLPVTSERFISGPNVLTLARTSAS